MRPPELGNKSIELVLVLTTLLALAAGSSSLGSKMAARAPQRLRPGSTPNRRSRRAGSTFSIGSTKAEVRSVQGPPHEAGDGTWQYGKSEVHFINGRVVSWLNDPSHPLRVR